MLTDKLTARDVFYSILSTNSTIIQEGIKVHPEIKVSTLKAPCIIVSSGLSIPEYTMSGTITHFTTEIKVSILANTLRLLEQIANEIIQLLNNLSGPITDDDETTCIILLDTTLTTTNDIWNETMTFENEEKQNAYTNELTFSVSFKY